MRWRSRLMLLQHACVIIGLRAPLSAQDAGYVSDIRRSGELHDCPTKPGAKPRDGDFIIQRSGTPIPSPKPLVTRLTIGDRLLATGNADIRLRITSDAFGQGAIFLAPDLLACSRLFIDTLARTEGGGRGAGYRLIDSATAPQGRLVFRIDSGAAYIQWNNTPLRRLFVVAGARTLEVDGTSLGVQVHPNGRSVVFVREGTVRIGTTVLQTSGVYDLVPGQAPQLRPPLTQQQTTNLTRDIEYHSDQVYNVNRPFYKHPAVVGSVGVALGAVVVWKVILPMFESENGGSVRVVIPL